MIRKEKITGGLGLCPIPRYDFSIVRNSCQLCVLYCACEQSIEARKRSFKRTRQMYDIGNITSPFDGGYQGKGSPGDLVVVSTHTYYTYVRGGRIIFHCVGASASIERKWQTGTIHRGADGSPANVPKIGQGTLP
jgi:hypothetical protein